MIQRRYVSTMVNSGLDGVVAATTRLSDVDGERGELVIAGYPVGELAGRATFEETTWLLWHGDLPSAGQLEAFRANLAAERDVPPATVALLRECARAGIEPMDALRIAAGTISLTSTGNPAGAIVARCPTIVAAFWRLRRGAEPIAPRARSGPCGELSLHVEWSRARRRAGSRARDVSQHGG